MKQPSSFAERRSRGDAAMTPMIDVVFLLLIFFVWTANFQTLEYLLPSSLSALAGAGAEPVDVTPEMRDFDPVIVKLLWQAARVRWLVNDSPVESLADVRATLVAVAQVKNEVPVIIDPQPEVPLGHVIDVYDISRLAGFAEVQFAASE